MNASLSAAPAVPPAGPVPDVSWTETVAQFVGRLNLSSPLAATGGYFQEIVALTCLIAGGFLVLFGWRHHRYVLAVVGMLAGGWTGLLIKGHLVPAGAVPALPYLALCGAIGAFLAISLRRFVGILLGGFTSACVAVVVLPAFVAPGAASTVALCLTFLAGGGLGALYPRFFFILNTSLMGASFCTYGLSVYLAKAGAKPAAGAGAILLHLGIFLPLLVAGMVYQYWKAPEEEETDLQPIRRAKPKAKAAARKAEKEPEPVEAT